MKKLFLALLCCMSFIMFGQQKIAFVDTQTVMTSMPEYTQAQKKFEDLQAKYEADLKSMQDDYRKKAEEYIKTKDSLTELIRNRKEQELQDIQGRIQQSYQAMQEDLAKQQQAMMAPLQQKITDAIKKLGDEQGYAYILDSAVMLYKGQSSIDATKLLMDKLGAKVAAPAPTSKKK